MIQCRTLTENELKVLLDAATLAKIPASDLKPVNPFSQQGDRAKAMQIAVQEINASQAARWRVEAGDSVSLAAAAAKAGLTEINRTVHEELSQLDADYITGQQESAARREADLLASLEKGAEELAAVREKQTAQFQRQTSTTGSTGAHNAEFMRRLGITNLRQLQGMPTSRLTKEQ